MDKIRDFNETELAQFIMNIEMDEISNMMCEKNCVHKVPDKKGEKYCEKENCTYSDEDMLRDWLLMEV